MSIRPYSKEDYPAVLQVWKEAGAMRCPWMTTESALETELDNAHTAVVSEVDDQIQAFAYIDPVQAGAETAHFFIIAPLADTERVLPQLWAYLKPHVQKLEAKRMAIGLMTDWGFADFFEEQGFKRSFYSFRLEYHGPAFLEPELVARPYEAADFPNILNLINEAFYEIRRDNDLQPYLVYGESAFTDERVKEKIAGKNYLVFTEGPDIVGYLEPEEPSLAVSQRYRGKGYGSAIARYCINRQIEQGRIPYLYVLESNRAARAMYEKVGYKVVAVVEAMRYEGQ